MHDMEFADNLLAIARAGAGTNNIPKDKCNACFGADMADMNRLIKSGGKCNFSCSSAVLGTGDVYKRQELYRDFQQSEVRGL